MMQNWKLYISSGIFVAVTVMKLLMPELTAHAREQIVALVDMDMDYRGMIVQVGQVLTDESVQEVVSFLFGEKQTALGETTPSPMPSPTEEPTPSVTPQPTETPTPVPTETPAPTSVPTEAPTAQVPESVLTAVEAFRVAQEAYADYETPEKVSYENLILPFSYASPVSGVLSSGFGFREHPIEHEIRFHYGTDYAVEEGTPIAAFADGEVTMTGYEKGYGNYVEITHTDGWKTLYAHCSEVHVKWYQQVKKGEIIALAGETGEATGPHLHLELTHDGYYTNPEFFF